MRILFRIFTIMGLLLVARLAVAQTQAPVLLFTDIVTGASSGGENGNGVYISIYGKNFGATQGSSTVTVGGVAPVQYKIWGSGNDPQNPLLDKVVIQIGPSTSTGNIVMTVNGIQSNALPFTVCTGHIYFVSPSGSDSNSGSFSSPWASPSHARSVSGAGDTVYFRAGTYTQQENFGAMILCGACGGSSGAWLNFLGYPGETAQLGSSAVPRSVVFVSSGGSIDYLAMGELYMQAGGESQTGVFGCSSSGGTHCNNIRLVSDNVHLTAGPSVAIDFELPATNIYIYGNESANNCPSGCSFDSRGYSFYAGGNGAQSNFDLGWNNFHDNPYGKGFQIYGHNNGESMTGLYIHDNLVYNNTMAGMDIGGSDSSTGHWVVDAHIYNNLFWNNSSANNGREHGALKISPFGGAYGTYYVYNNTFYENAYDGGSGIGGSLSIEGSGPAAAYYDNNILYAYPGASCLVYIETTGAFGSVLHFSNNLYNGAGNGITLCNNTGAAPSPDPAPVTGDPLFVSTSAPDFHLATTSPAIGAGTSALTTARDLDGKPRPVPPSIGAYEFASGVSVNRPPPPTNLSVVVQ